LENIDEFCTPFYNYLNEISTSCQNKTPQVKENVVLWIAKCILKKPLNSFNLFETKILEIMSELLSDGNLGVRKASQMVVGSLCSIGSVKAQQFVEKLDNNVSESIKLYIKSLNPQSIEKEIKIEKDKIDIKRDDKIKVEEKKKDEKVVVDNKKRSSTEALSQEKSNKKQKTSLKSNNDSIRSENINTTPSVSQESAKSRAIEMFSETILSSDRCLKIVLIVKVHIFYLLEMLQ